MLSGEFKKGSWTAAEDELLLEFVKKNGPEAWNRAHEYFPDLRRAGKSCRLRYLNQLHPGIVRAPITPAEERIILMAHAILGNQWSRIAALLPGRTDNNVKNVVNMRLKRARRHAASLTFARAAARMLREQVIGTPSSPRMEASPIPDNHSSLPSVSAFCVPVLSSPPAGMHPMQRRSSTCAGSYSAIAGSNPSARMSTPMQSNRVTDELLMAASSQLQSLLFPAGHFGAHPDMDMSQSVAPPSDQATQFSAELFDDKWVMQSQLPSVQMESQLPSVQTQPFQSFASSERQAQLPSVQQHFFQRFTSPERKLPSVQLQQSISIDISEMAHHCSNIAASGDKDLLEAMIKVDGFASPSSTSSGSSSSSSPIARSPRLVDDSYVNEIQMGYHEGQRQSPAMSADIHAPSLLYAGLDLPTDHSSVSTPLFMRSSLLEHLAKEETLSRSGGVGDLLMMGDMEGDLASVVLSSPWGWSSMPGACEVGESDPTDVFIPDFD